MSIEKEENIDLRNLLFRLIRKWPLFLISIVLFCSFGLLYLAFTPKQYEVQALLQLNDQDLSEKGTGNEKFLTGLELLENRSELEDEIGIISSVSMIERTVKALDFTVTILKSGKTGITKLDLKSASEVYKGELGIVPDLTKPQITNTPIYLKVFANGTAEISVEDENVQIYDLESQSLIKKVSKINLSSKLTSNHFENEYLTIDINFDQAHAFEDGDEYIILIRPLEDLTKEYTNKLRIDKISKESNIVKIATNGRTPDKEIDFINSLMEQYIRADLDKKNMLGIKTIEFIDRQLGSVYDSLISVENNLEYFRSANTIMDVSATLTSLKEQEQKLIEERSTLNTQKEYFDYVLTKLNNPENIGEVVSPSSVGINDPFLNDLLVQLSELNKEKIDKAFRSKESNPVIQVINQKIESTRELLIENITNLIKSTNINLYENSQRVANIRTQIEALPQSERSLSNIERQFSLNDNIYNYLLQKRAEAGIALASNLPDKTIVDIARHLNKNPVTPNTKLILAISLVLGLAAPIGLIIVLEFLNTKIKEPKTLESRYGVNIIGKVNQLKNTEVKNLMNKDQKASVPAMDMSAFSLLNFSDISRPVIAFTSAQQSDGKSVCAFGIAKSLASFGKTTLYIDTNFQKIRLNGSLKKESLDPRNLAGYLDRRKELKGVVKKTSIPNLYTIMSGYIDEAETTPIIKYHERLSQMIKSLKDRFEVIIIDAPKATSQINYKVMSQNFDINVLVVRKKHTTYESFEEAQALFNGNGSHNVCVLFNEA